MVTRRSAVPGDPRRTPLTYKLVVALVAVVMLACFAAAVAAIVLVDGEPTLREVTRSTVAPGGPVATEVSLPGPTTQEPALAPETPLPVRVDLPSIGVSSELTDLHLQPNGSLEAPDDFAVAGWWVGGTRPGDPGPAVVVGHVDSFRGPAVFFKLGLLEQGSQVSIQRKDGSSVTFQVTELGRYPKNQFPTQLVYGSTLEPTLRLITCGGVFDRETHTYQDNVVVFARQVTPPATQAGDAQ